MNNQEKIKALQEQLADLQLQITALVYDKEEEQANTFPAMLPDSGEFMLADENFKAEERELERLFCE